MCLRTAKLLAADMHLHLNTGEVGLHECNPPRGGGGWWLHESGGSLNVIKCRKLLKSRRSHRGELKNTLHDGIDMFNSMNCSFRLAQVSDYSEEDKHDVIFSKSYFYFQCRTGKA